VVECREDVVRTRFWSWVSKHTTVVELVLDDSIKGGMIRLYFAGGR